MSPSNPHQRVRMRDVANRCGVSISTVSLVLSGDPRIPEDTVRKVLQAVKALEYRPSVVARNLARRSSRTIGVILPEVAFDTNPQFYYQALSGIHAQTQPAGYKLVVEAVNKVFIERRYYHRLLKEQSADAMLYLAANIDDIFLNEMAREPFPFVLVGCLPRDVDISVVRGNDAAGAQMGVEHLVKLGHKKIGFISGLETNTYGVERKAGFMNGMKQASLDVDPKAIFAGDFDTAKAEAGAAQMIEAGVTAVFCASDNMAYGLMRGLKNKGISVPNDVAVVGMDDLIQSEWMNPSLTTVRYDIKEMAATAAKFVINKIKSPLIKPDVLNDVPAPKLIVRGSCGSQK